MRGEQWIKLHYCFWQITCRTKTLFLFSYLLLGLPNNIEVVMHMNIFSAHTHSYTALLLVHTLSKPFNIKCLGNPQCVFIKYLVKLHDFTTIRTTVAATPTPTTTTLFTIESNRLFVYPCYQHHVSIIWTFYPLFAASWTGEDWPGIKLASCPLFHWFWNVPAL